MGQVRKVFNKRSSSLLCLCIVSLTFESKQQNYLVVFLPSGSQVQYMTYFLLLVSSGTTTGAIFALLKSPTSFEPRFDPSIGTKHLNLTLFEFQRPHDLG